MKKLASMLAVIAILAVIAACAIGGYSLFRKNQKPKKVYAMPEAMTFSAVTQAGGVDIYAEIIPDYALDKGLNWNVEFVNPASEWAAGKTVTDYVTVTPGEPESIATVECKAAFGEQIKIKVASTSNPEARAECICDYIAAPAALKINLESVMYDVDGTTEMFRRTLTPESNSSANGVIQASPVSALGSLNKKYKSYVTYEITFGVGTIQEEYEVKNQRIEVMGAQMLASNFSAAGLTAQYYTINNLNITEESNTTFNEDCIKQMFGISNDNYGKTLTALNSFYNEGMGRFSLFLRVESPSGKGIQSSINFRLDVSNLMTVQEVKLNNKNLQF